MAAPKYVLMNLGNHAPPAENLRHFNSNDDGTVTVVDMTTLKQITLSDYAGDVDNDEDAHAHRIHPINGALPSLVNPAYIESFLHSAAITSFQIMFARAQDACRELIISIPACLSAHADVKKLCEESPEAAKKTFEMMRESMEMCAAQDRGSDTTTPAAGEFDAKFKFVQLAEALKRKLDLLPTEAKIIANEFRRLLANPPARTDLPAASLKTLARKLIKQKEAHEIILPALEATIFQLREYGEGSA